MTEEEIKVKYVLPWLEHSGVALHEIQLERTFTVKVGRQTITVGKGRNRNKNSVSGRLDILVQRDNRNLLIVETKADGVQLTNDDRDQAISYARLVHPIAPYAVVTNGQEYRLYDSVSKEMLDPKEIMIRGFEAVLPDDAISEAQSIFLGLDTTNLVAFCRSQVAGELRIVKGTLTDGRKYIPELHAPRDAILEKVKEFDSSPLPGLLLIGQSGTGKTCEMCCLAESLLDSGKPVLFFNGVALEAGILEAIATEFSWTFNGLDLPIQVVRRMAMLAGNQRLTIIVDAIDEWKYPSCENNLGSLLRAAENNNIKIIVSCKTSAVEHFVSDRGNQTNIDLLTMKVEAGVFSAKEFSAVIEKYREVYQFFGAFEDAVLVEARSNPFLLRVLFDVAVGSKVKHLTFSSAGFFETYFHRSISKTADTRQAEYTVKAIAELCYERNTDWIAEDEVRRSLNLRVTEPLMDELFEYSILQRGGVESSTSVIGFYFQQLRDYVIAFKVRQFNKYSQQRLADEFSKVTELGTRADVFTLYYRLAALEHKIVFDRDVRRNAANYLHLYTTLVHQDFPALRETFKPETEGRVGFIGELLLVKRCLGAYGFRSLGDDDDEIYFVPVQQVLGKSNLTYLHGADQLHLTSSANGFQDGIDVAAEVIEHELMPQLEQFVKEGKLNESHCPEMLIEYLVEHVLQNRALFKEVLNADGQSIMYPLKLNEVLKSLLREKLIRHYRDRLVTTRRKTGEIEDKWDGELVSYSVNLNAEDEKHVMDEAEVSLSSGYLPRFNARDIDLDALECSLVKVCDSLSLIKTEIDGPLFYDESLLKVSVMRGQPISNINAKGYLQWLYSSFLTNYKDIVETNFPTLKQHFLTYSKLPISVNIVLANSIGSGFPRCLTRLDIYFSQSQSGVNEVKIVEEITNNTEGQFIYYMDGAAVRPYLVSSSYFEQLFFSGTGSAGSPFCGMTLRRLVYQTISNELKAIKQALLAQCKAVAIQHRNIET